MCFTMEGLSFVLVCMELILSGSDLFLASTDVERVIAVINIETFSLSRLHFLVIESFFPESFLK